MSEAIHVAVGDCSDMPLPGVVGLDPAMRAVYRAVRRLAPLDCAVMIIGETGTGKELVAAALHDLSGRPRARFVAVNAPALPTTLFESEMFGHARGAFSDARDERPGLVELAHGGTLYLDELGALSEPCQAKLLRVVEERRARRVGDLRARPAAPRWVASCQSLDEATGCARGLREDLWYRLSEEVVMLPPLRDRREDIPTLVTHFLDSERRPSPQVEPAALELLVGASWRGNVRELKHMVSRLAANAHDRRITAAHVRHMICRPSDSRRERERAMLLSFCADHGWEARRVARAMGMGLSTLYRRLMEAGISLREERDSRSSRRIPEIEENTSSCL